MSGYPELDDLMPQLEALRARTDFRSREWHQAADEVGQAFDLIAAKRDELAAWLPEAKAWLDQHPDHERHSERMKTYLLRRQKHKSFRDALDRAAKVITGLAEPVPADDPAISSTTEQLTIDESNTRRASLTARVRQRRKPAA